MSEFLPSREEVEKVLLKSHLLVFGMIDGKEPYLLPMNYGYEDGAFYLHSGAKRGKVKIIRENPVVGFLVQTDLSEVKGDMACKWTTRFRSVTGVGRCEIIEDLEGKIRGYDIISAHHGAPLGNYKEKAVEKSVIIRIEILKASARSHGY